jgi:hypothetical protein
MSAASAPGRTAFRIAGVLVAAYTAIVVLGKLSTVFAGARFAWLPGDIIEFLIVLVAMVFFVAGVLACERAEPPPSDSA